MTTRKRRFTKRKTKKGQTKQVKANKMAIARLKGSEEWKYITNSISGITISDNTFNLLNGIGTGGTQGSRVANQIVMKSLDFNLIYFNDTLPAADSIGTVTQQRIIIFVNKKNNRELASSTDLTELLSTIPAAPTQGEFAAATFNPDFTSKRHDRKYRIVYDKFMSLSVGSAMSFKISQHLTLGEKCQFSTNGTTGTAIEANAVILAIIGMDADGSYEISSTLHYTDS